jgi:hypothetical protein
MSDKFDSQHSPSPTIWSDIVVVVGRESGYLKIFFTFLEVNMSNILWSMRVCKRTFFPVYRMSGYVNTGKTRQFGTKTFRHPLKKTVRHQDISASVEKTFRHLLKRQFGTCNMHILCIFYLVLSLLILCVFHHFQCF